MTASNNTFNTRAHMTLNGKEYRYFSLNALKDAGFDNIDRLPLSGNIFNGQGADHLQLPPIKP